MPRILVAVDGSTHSDNAVRFAIELCRRSDATELHLITVQPMLPGDVLAFVPKTNIDAFYKEGGEKALASARALLDAAKLPYKTHVGIGPTGPTIVDYAKAQNCAQIIMGSRGHGAAVNLLLGSVATSVIAQAPQPVTIVK
jgi:nucleotide-binding universal stress UspA family protein